MAGAMRQATKWQGLAWQERLVATPFPSLTLALGASGPRFSAGTPRDWRPPLAALGAAALALMLGLLHGLPAAPALFSPALSGLMVATAIGALGWHVARLTARPAAQGGLGAAALPAALAIFLFVPEASVGALAPALPLALAAAWRDAAQRVVALVVHCGALLAFAAVASDNAFGYQCACAILLVGAGLAAHQSVRSAANDNPLMKRNVVSSRLAQAKSRLLPIACHARERRDSLMGNRGVTNVQEQQSRS